MLNSEKNPEKTYLKHFTLLPLTHLSLKNYCPLIQHFLLWARLRLLTSCLDRSVCLNFLCRPNFLCHPSWMLTCELLSHTTADQHTNSVCSHGWRKAVGVAQQEQALSNLYSPALLGFFKNLFIVRLKLYDYLPCNSFCITYFCFKDNRLEQCH